MTATATLPTPGVDLLDAGTSLMERCIEGITNFFDSWAWKNFAVPFSIAFFASFATMVLFMINPLTLFFTIPMLFACGFGIGVIAVS